MEVVVPFLVIAALVFLNGVFVAAEFAIIGVRPTHIKQLADEGNAVAKRLYNTLTNPAKVDRYIASAQLGITLASLGLGMYGEPAVSHLIEAPLRDWFGLGSEAIHTIGFFVALALITYLHVVVGEMVPKSLSLQNAERAAFLLATPMAVMQTVFAFPITLLNKTGVLVLKLLRVPRPASGSRLVTPDELELIVSESVVGGLIEAEEQELINSIFDFGDLDVAQIMVPRPKINGLPISISEEEMLERVVTSPNTRFPVYDGTLDNIVGVLHLKDVVEQQIEKRPFDITAMLHETPFIPETTSAETLLATFKREHVHMAVVVDEYGGTAGIVTLEDLIEEIVGEVRDEFDMDEQEPISVVQPGHIVVDGTVRLDEIAEYVDLGEDHEDVETIGGLMISRVDLPPSQGDEIHINGITLRIEQVDGLAIERVSIQFPPGETKLEEAD